MKNIFEALRDNAESRADKKALITANEELTYGQLMDKAKVICGYLAEIGIQKGNLVILEALPEAAFVETYLAVQMSGAVTVPVEKGIDIYKLYYLANHIDAKLVIGNEGFAGLNTPFITYAELVSKAEENDNAVNVEGIDNDSLSEIILTVGSSGIAKAAMHSAGGMACITDNSLNGVGTRADDVVMIPLPMNHAFGLRVLRTTLTAGGCAVLPKDHVSVEALIEMIRENECTAMSCIPETMENALREIGNVRACREFAPLRYIEFGAGAVPAAMREKLTVILPHTDILNTWGSPETGGCLFVNVSRKPEKMKSAGCTINHITLGIYSEKTGEFLEGSGEENRGLLAIKGDMIFKGYLNNDEIYQKSVKDGWFVTDDMVWRDEDGYYYIIGRIGDIIRIDDKIAAPYEIENSVYNLPEIKECACIGIEDEENLGNEIPVLVYVENLDRKADEAKILKEISEAVEPCMVPKELVKVYGIPKTFIKKVDRKLIKKTYMESGAEGLRNL